MRAGLDDFGSGCFKGFACIVLGEAHAAALEARGKIIRDAANLAEFHACRFDAGIHASVTAYQNFALVIKEEVINSNGYAVFQLMHESVFYDVDALRYLVTEAVLNQLIKSGAPQFTKDKAGALFIMARHLSLVPSIGSVSVEMDKTHDKDIINSEESVDLSGTFGGVQESASGALVRVANNYKSQKFSSGPQFGSLRICDSKDSILVQAADVLANFGINYVKSKLRGQGSTSSRRELEKAKIFESIVESSELPQNTLSVTNENNLTGSVGDNLLCKIIS